MIQIRQELAFRLCRILRSINGSTEVGMTRSTPRRILEQRIATPSVTCIRSRKVSSVTNLETYCLEIARENWKPTLREYRSRLNRFSVGQERSFQKSWASGIDDSAIFRRHSQYVQRLRPRVGKPKCGS